MGFHVFASCHTSASAEKLQEVCSDRVTAFVLDVADEDNILQARDFVEKKLPTGVGLWAVVNNAGVTGPMAPAEWVTRQGFLSCLQVNLLGLMDVTRIFLPLVRRARGRAVNMTSMLGRISTWMCAILRELAHQGIKVCIIEPGYFKSPMACAARWVAMFTPHYNITPEDVRQLYPDFAPDKHARKAEILAAKACNRPDAVIDAYITALTSRFPPARQIVGTDARFIFRPLWILPTLFSDWIIARL